MIGHEVLGGDWRWGPSIWGWAQCMFLFRTAFSFWPKVVNRGRLCYHYRLWLMWRSCHRGGIMFHSRVFRLTRESFCFFSRCQIRPLLGLVVLLTTLVVGGPCATK